MITFIFSLVALVLAYFFYGRFLADFIHLEQKSIRLDDTASSAVAVAVLVVSVVWFALWKRAFDKKISLGSI